MPELLSGSFTRTKLDTTLILDATLRADEDEKIQSPLFALVSLNHLTAPSLEVPWSQLLSLSISPEMEPPVFKVGRHKECSVQLADPRVSLHHFEIATRRKSIHLGVHADEFAYDCFLNDLSSNGTSINGRTVGKGRSQQLRSGDEICVLPTHKVGQDKRIAFVFRNSTESLATPEVKQLDLDELVICPICMQPIYKCVALMPCFHNFCMSCYSEWMCRKDECPVCRQNVTAVMKNHAMDSVVEAFLQAFPERRRSMEELQEMDIRDKLRLSAGGKIVKDVCMVAPVGTLPSIPAATTPISIEAVRNNSSATVPATTNSGATISAPETASGRLRVGTQVCSIQ
jgi:pSer/pThr/pTyr-binding forkhead associated (FHA) protein